MISNNTDEITGVSIISFVKSPAIESNFIKFSADDNIQPTVLKMSIQDEEKRIVTGAVLIPDLPVYRKDESGEYYIYCDKECIYQIAQKFFKTNRNNNVDTEHSGLLLPGITLFESFIADEERGINCPKAYAGLPDGTWFASFKVDNDEVWNEIKAGTFLGFSITGLFDMEKQPVTLSSTREYEKNLIEIYNELSSIVSEL